MPERRGSLSVVATPIGNLGDLSPRAVSALRDADLVCCEDTRRTRALLAAAGVPAGRRLLSLHADNELSRLPHLLAALAQGKSVALVSDAGTPMVSDPGARLVAAAQADGVAATAVPGPSALLAALAVSGLPADRFVFEGFLPRKGAERRRRLDALVVEERTAVVFEAPRRLAATLKDLAERSPERTVAVCRELTKLHEEVWRGTLEAAASEFAGREVRGEVVVVIGGSLSGSAGKVRLREADIEDAVNRRLAGGASTREAAAAVAAELGVPRRRAYEAAVAARRGGEPPHPRR